MAFETVKAFLHERGLTRSRSYWTTERRKSDCVVERVYVSPYLTVGAATIDTGCGSDTFPVTTRKRRITLKDTRVSPECQLATLDCVCDAAFAGLNVGDHVQVDYSSQGCDYLDYAPPDYSRKVVVERKVLRPIIFSVRPIRGKA